MTNHEQSQPGEKPNEDHNDNFVRIDENQNQPNQEIHRPNENQYINQYVNPNQQQGNQPTRIVVNNQVGLGVPLNFFKTEPIMIFCPSCKKSGATNVKKSFSILNYCCYFWFGVLYWVLLQLIRDKGYNFQDAEHYCSHCGCLIVSYTSC